MEDDEEYFYETDDDDISIIGYEGEPVVRGVPSPFIVQTIESSNDWLHDALAAIHEVEIATEELLYRSKLLTAARETRDYEESVAASERFVVPWSDEGVYHVPELDLDNSDSEESEDEDNDHVSVLKLNHQCSRKRNNTIVNRWLSSPPLPLFPLRSYRKTSYPMQRILKSRFQIYHYPRDHLIPPLASSSSPQEIPYDWKFQKREAGLTLR